MNKVTVAEVIADVRELPALPAAVTHLIAALRQREISIEQLADGIARDQALAARALRVANSAFYGVQHKVGTIQDAIVVLGLRAVGSLVTAAAVTGFFKLPEKSGINLTVFWRHSMGVALAARTLARSTDMDVEAAFTAGLLHDIGRLMLAATRPAVYRQVLDWRKANDCPLTEAERQVLGFDHSVAGAALAERWKFPAAIRDAVAGYHAPSLQPKRSLADVVHVADVLAHALDLAGDPDDAVPCLDAAAWQRLGLNGEALKPVLAQVDTMHETYCSLLSA